MLIKNSPYHPFNEYNQKKIGPGVKIGSNCIIGDNVTIYYSIISDNVKIYNGVRIGGEGFGFISSKNFFKKIPQLGRVIIKDNKYESKNI